MKHLHSHICTSLPAHPTLSTGVCEGLLEQCRLTKALGLIAHIKRDLGSDYGTIKKRLFLLAEAFKTILTPNSPHPYPGSVVSGNIRNPSTWDPEEFTKSKWLSRVCIVCFSVISFSCN